MNKLPLERKPSGDKRILPWKSCAPFVENSRGVLIHRPRSAATYNIHKTPHWAIRFYCGMTTTGMNQYSFHEAPPVGRVLCEKCEQKAVEVGQPSADSLAGRHVHIGGVKAVITCCARVQ